MTDLLPESLQVVIDGVYHTAEYIGYEVDLAGVPTRYIVLGLRKGKPPKTNTVERLEWVETQRGTRFAVANGHSFELRPELGCQRLWATLPDRRTDVDLGLYARADLAIGIADFLNKKLAEAGPFEDDAESPIPGWLDALLGGLL